MFGVRWWIIVQISGATLHGRASQEHGHHGMLLLPRAWERFGLRKCRVRAAGTCPGSVSAYYTLNWVKMQLIRDLYQPKLMCCSRSRCIPSTGMASCKAVTAGVATTITTGLFYFPSFSLLCDCCLKQRSFICQACWRKCSHIGSARLDEGNGPQSIKAKSLPNFWETRFYHLAPKTPLNTLQWD